MDNQPINCDHILIQMFPFGPLFYKGASAATERVSHRVYGKKEAGRGIGSPTGAGEQGIHLIVHN